MRCVVDQSGKVEHTNKLTVVAFSNGIQKSLVISAVEKRKLLVAMRERDYPKQLFVFKVFSALVFLLIRRERIDELVIDREYPGHEGIIKDVLGGLFRGVGLSTPSIVFDEIGKGDAAHKAAIAVYRGKQKPNMIVTSGDVLRLFYGK